MKTPIIIGGVLVLLAAGVWYWSMGANETPTPETNTDESARANVETMTASNALPITTEEIEYYPGAIGYFARPDVEGSHPGVVMIHENRGLRPEIRTAAEELAKAGYLVLAVNLLDGVAEDQEGARALTATFNQKTGVENMRAAVAYLRAADAPRIASLGWCFGGRQSIELAISGETLDATVVYYGGGMATTTTALAPISWPVLGIFGDQDRIIPLSHVDAFKASLTELGIENEVHVYPGVGHAFANPSGPNYAPEPTADAWNKTLAFLERTLRPGESIQ
jgi:carboxymethylenebutenolidase